MANTIRQRPQITRSPLLPAPDRTQPEADAGGTEGVAGVAGGEPIGLADLLPKRPGVHGKTATGLDYEHINQPARFDEYLRSLAVGTGPVAIDFETSDLRPRFASIVGIALAESIGGGVYISGELGIDLAVGLGKVLAACKNRQLVAYNAVYELSIAANVLGQIPLRDWSPEMRLWLDNIEPNPRMVVNNGPDVGRRERAVLRSLTGIDDPLIMARLAGYEYEIGLKDQARIQYGVKMTDIEVLIGKGKNQITMEEVDPHLAAPYAVDDAAYTLALRDTLWAKLPATVRDVYSYIERPLLPVTASMGLSGMDLDREAIERAAEAVTRRIEELHDEIQEEFAKAVERGDVRKIWEPSPSKKNPTRKRPRYEAPDGRLIGPPASVSYPGSLRWKYNPGSSGQASAFLGLPDAQAGTYELSGMPLALKHRDYDHYRKLLSSYIEPVRRMFDDGGRGYFSLNQAGTGTGRFSCGGWKLRDGQWGINAQTKPKPKANEDASDPNTESKLIGRQFSAGQGRSFVEIDYSQIELRVEAHRAPEPNMIEAYRSGRDLHDEMMRRSGLKDRRLAKVANFGCSYEDNDWVAAGVVKRNAAKSDILVTDEEAMETVKAFREAWPGLIPYYAEIDARIQRYGYVETLAGRRLYRKYVPYPGPKPRRVEEPLDRTAYETPDKYETAVKAWEAWQDWKKIDQINAARRREAINMPIQGSAADILKKALVQLWLALPDWVEIVLTVHDSILFRCDTDRVKDLVAWAKPIMESPDLMELDVPLKVDAEAGPNWADLKEIA